MYHTSFPVTHTHVIFGGITPKQRSYHRCGVFRKVLQLCVVCSANNIFMPTKCCCVPPNIVIKKCVSCIVFDVIVIQLNVAVHMIQTRRKGTYMHACMHSYI